MINVEVVKTGGESSGSLLRRFSKRIQTSGVIKKVRKIRYHARPETKFGKKKHTMAKLKRRAAYEELSRWGKIKPETERRGRR